MNNRRKNAYKSPVYCWNSYWEITYEDKNTNNSKNTTPKPIHTLVMGQKVQNNNKQKEKNTEKTKIQK